MSRNYTDFEASPSFKRRCHKWAMVAHKGGKCACCNERVTVGTFEYFDFDHKEPLKNAHDKTERWSGAIRDWPPFTDKWFAWAETVDLVCSECHHRKHSVKKQMDLDFEAIQARLDQVANSPHPTEQISMWQEAAE